jgi:hypothetical protein
MSCSPARRVRAGPRLDRCRGDEGSGLIGTIGAVVVFLAFLLFAVQLLVGLYGRSVVTSAAYDGARLVAGHRSSDRVAARTDAEQRMRQLVGGLDPQFDWSGSDDDIVVLRVQADNPRFMLPGFAGPLATDHIDRTVTVRVERVR